jgi:hypothetical protein
MKLENILYDSNTGRFFSDKKADKVTIGGHIKYTMNIEKIDTLPDNIVTIDVPAIQYQIFHYCYSHGFEDMIVLFNYKLHQLQTSSRKCAIFFVNHLSSIHPEHATNRVVDTNTWTYKMPSYNEFVNFLSDTPPIWAEKPNTLVFFKHLELMDDCRWYIPNNTPESYPNRPNTLMFPLDTMSLWLKTLRDEMLRFYEIGLPTHRRKILINRKANRFIEKGSVDMLLNLIPDLEVVYLETMTLRDQILVLKDAELIISPHGASMFNTLFCKEGAHIIELFPRSHETTRIFQHYCGLLGHRIFTYIENPNSYGFPYDTEFFITANRVVNLLRAL